MFDWSLNVDKIEDSNIKHVDKTILVILFNSEIFVGYFQIF